MKVVFHLDEMEKWPLTLANVNNFLAADPDAEIIVLANAIAVKGFVESKEELIALEEKVQFSACSNALTNFKIDYEQVSENVRIEPGVYTLAKLQHEGYAYIRP